MIHTQGNTIDLHCSPAAHRSEGNFGSTDTRHPEPIQGPPQASQVEMRDRWLRSPSRRPKAIMASWVAELALAAVGVNSRAPLSVRPSLTGLPGVALFWIPPAKPHNPAQPSHLPSSFQFSSALPLQRADWRPYLMLKTLGSRTAYHVQRRALDSLSPLIPTMPKIISCLI